MYVFKCVPIRVHVIAVHVVLLVHKRCLYVTNRCGVHAIQSMEYAWDRNNS